MTKAGARCSCDVCQKEVAELVADAEARGRAEGAQMSEKRGGLSDTFRVYDCEHAGTDGECAYEDHQCSAPRLSPEGLQTAVGHYVPSADGTRLVQPAARLSPEDQAIVAGALAQLRHAYQQLMAGQVKHTAVLAEGLLAPQIRQLEALLTRLTGGAEK